MYTWEKPYCEKLCIYRYRLVNGTSGKGIGENIVSVTTRYLYPAYLCSFQVCPQIAIANRLDLPLSLPPSSALKVDHSRREEREGGRSSDGFSPASADVGAATRATVRPPYRLIKVRATFIFNLYNDFAKMYLGRARILHPGFAIHDSTLSLVILKNSWSPQPLCLLAKFAKV